MRLRRSRTRPTHRVASTVEIFDGKVVAFEQIDEIADDREQILSGGLWLQQGAETGR